MKKYTVLCAGLCLALAFTSCKSSESAYKKAYEDNVSVRQERVSMVSGNGLKAFSVVVGSFGLVSNAEGLQQRLRDAGYDAQIVKNEDRNMYRVIAATFDNKADAARSRDQLRATYADAWLLSNQ